MNFANGGKQEAMAQHSNQHNYREKNATENSSDQKNYYRKKTFQATAQGMENKTVLMCKTYLPV